MKKIGNATVWGLAVALTIGLAGTVQAAPGDELLNENWDASLGVLGGISFPGASPWSTDVSGTSTIGQNGGSTDPDWGNWGGPSVGDPAPYNQGMEDEADRALGLYKTGVNEEPAFIQYDLELTSPVAGIEIKFDVEVPMARSNQGEYTTSFDVKVDGALLGNSGNLVNNANLTAWNWSDDSVHYWLNDAEMDAGGLALRGVALTTGPLEAGTHAIRWEIPKGGTNRRMHTGLDNIVITEVPEPASLALLGLGGLALMRRRRA